MDKRIECEHKNVFGMECKGAVAITEYGYLCVAHDYRAFLAKRNGSDVHPDSYGVRENYDGTLFDFEGGK